MWLEKYNFLVSKYFGYKKMTLQLINIAISSSRNSKDIIFEMLSFATTKIASRPRS